MDKSSDAASGAAAIVIGDEILSGKIQDTNGPYLVQKLRAVGLPLRRILVVADDVDEIAWAVTCCIGRYAPIFTSGGIGPTHDDCTVAGVAAGLDRGVVRNPELEALVREHFGEGMPEEALRLANTPEGAVLWRSPQSWYPVISVEGIYLLPGIPQLFRMHADALAEQFRGAPFHLRQVYLSIGEARIARILDEMTRAFPDVALGSYPRIDDADHRVKLTLEAQEKAPVEDALRVLLERLPREAVVRVE